MRYSKIWLLTCFWSDGMGSLTQYYYGVDVTPGSYGDQVSIWGSNELEANCPKGKSEILRSVAKLWEEVI
ncbi:hypothetical protein MASR1M31_09430 [Porphyromonadaceae bacterium]